METCPSCKTAFKSGLLSSNVKLKSLYSELINEYTENQNKEHCTCCGREVLKIAEAKYEQDVKDLKFVVQTGIKNILIISTILPPGWDYEMMDMVTAQTTTGTGLITELTSSYTDIFGMQSSRMNDKLSAGEDMCFQTLRKKAFQKGANAIVSTDIDYGEVGGGKGILMVCMSGTAVKVRNFEEIAPERNELIEKAQNAGERLKYLMKYKL